MIRQTDRDPIGQSAQRTMRTWGMSVVPALGLAVLLPGCLLRDGGASEERSGPVLAGGVCGAAVGGDTATGQGQGAGSGAGSITGSVAGSIAGVACPACSTADPATGACRDVWYAAGRRCTVDVQCAGGRCAQGYCVTTDRDQDDIDDALEAEVAARNLPVLWRAGGESCGDPSGIVYRVRRHPEAPRRLAVTYVVLFDRDCGPLNGHTGDDEALAVTVDLDARPGAPATVGVGTLAHAHTACESASTCESAPGTAACGAPTSTAADAPLEVHVFSSRNKHANYLALGTCDRNCMDACGAGERIAGLRLVNAGEADHPLTRDLSAPDGFVTTQAGWSRALLHYDPWSEVDFGGAGRVARLLAEVIAPPGRPLPALATPSVAAAPSPSPVVATAAIAP